MERRAAVAVLMVLRPPPGSNDRRKRSRGEATWWFQALLFEAPRAAERCWTVAWCCCDGAPALSHWQVPWGSFPASFGGGW